MLRWSTPRYTLKQNLTPHWCYPRALWCLNRSSKSKCNASRGWDYPSASKASAVASGRFQYFWNRHFPLTSTRPVFCTQSCCAVWMLQSLYTAFVMCGVLTVSYNFVWNWNAKNELKFACKRLKHKGLVIQTDIPMVRPRITPSLFSISVTINQLLVVNWLTN